jgi:hypothetical protein
MTVHYGTIDVKVRRWNSHTGAENLVTNETKPSDEQCSVGRGQTACDTAGCSGIEGTQHYY